MYISADPVSKAAKVSYTLSKPSEVSLFLHDVNGNLLYTFFQNEYRDGIENLELLNLPKDIEKGQFLLKLKSKTKCIHMLLVVN